MRDRKLRKDDMLDQMMDDLNSRGEHDIAVQTVERLVSFLQNVKTSLPAPEPVFTKKGNHNAKTKKDIIKHNSDLFLAMFELLFEPAVLRTEKEMDDE